jgi:hypothetical protein
VHLCAYMFGREMTSVGDGDSSSRMLLLSSLPLFYFFLSLSYVAPVHTVAPVTYRLPLLDAIMRLFLVLLIMATFLALFLSRFYFCVALFTIQKKKTIVEPLQ